MEGAELNREGRKSLIEARVGAEMLTLESWSTGGMAEVLLVSGRDSGREQCACMSGVGMLREPEKEAAVRGPVLHSEL